MTPTVHEKIEGFQNDGANKCGIALGFDNCAKRVAASKQFDVRSRFHVMELRRDDVRHFAGAYRHELKKTKDGYRIKLQRVDMTNAQAAYDYVLQMWV